MKAKKNITGAVLRSTKLLEKILNSVGSPVFVKDRKHRWIYMNKACCEFMGHSREELLGRTDHDFFPAVQADVCWKKDDQTFATRAQTVNEEFFTDAAGSTRAIQTRKQVFRDEGGEDVLVGVINDITALKKANDDLALFRKLLETSNDAIFIVNPEDGSFLDFNETACRRLGYRRDTLLRMGVPDIQSTVPSHGDWEKLRGKIKASGHLFIEGRHIRADGTSFPVEISATHSVVDGSEYFYASARDITERKRLEEAMQEADALRGLIPICAKCKKIRDDKGFWEKVEVYLEKHSGARFTHGLCKECMAELYGKEKWFRGKEK
ncbi:MAG: PAS domain-containing protein [Elusimicrobiales bacterium]|nr:PAS domain-containing protein [Elusimicrobiales bacterium]